MSFYNDLERGKIGEEVLFEILNNAKEIAYIKDVREDAQAQKNDYDFIYKKNRFQILPTKAEVKTDERIGETNNIFAEHHCIYKRNNEEGQGWIQYTKADKIYYYDSINEWFYVFKTSDLKKYIQENNPKMVQAYDKNKTMYGYLVDVTKLSESYEVGALYKNGEWY